ncbi:4527_t:CDS:2, partial [Cetraspora pellucida]
MDDEWTCENVIKYYQENNHLLDFKQTLDKINKDLKEISKFDPVATCREKAKTYNLQLEGTVCLLEKGKGRKKKLNNCLLFGHELFVPAKPYTASQSEWSKNAKEDNKMQGLIAERNVPMVIVFEPAYVMNCNKMVRTALARQLEDFESECTQASNNLERFKDKNYENSNENVMSNLKEKPQQSITFLSKKRAHNTLQESEKNITDEDLVNSVNDASDTFGQVEFPSFYNEEKKKNIHDDTVVDEVTESNLLDKNNEETKYTEGDNENFDKSITKMKEIMHQLDDLSEKYHYLSNTFPITAQNYDQIKMPDMFIIKSIASHLDTIIKMNGAIKNVPERTWTAH